MHKFFSSGKNKRCRKNWNPVAKSRIFYVNRKLHIHSPAACGIRLWKNLWRMWKSASFQQVFPAFTTGLSPDGSLHILLHIFGQYSSCNVLRHHPLTKTTPIKKSEIVEFFHFFICRKNAVPAITQKFCENRQILLPAPSRQKHAPTVSSADSGECFQYVNQGGTPCREK